MKLINSLLDAHKTPLPNLANSVASIQADACGKAIIIGEHAAVYGSKAIAMPLSSMRFKLKMKPLPYQADAFIQLTLNNKLTSPHLTSTVSEALEQLNIKPIALEITSHSNLPIGAGLGSSASFCVAITRVLCKYLNRNADQDFTACIANELERRFHGNPSGLDTAVVSYEQVILFEKGQKPQPLAIGKVNHNHCNSFIWPFILIDSGIRSSTMQMIQLAKPYFTGKKGQLRISRFHQLSDLATKDLKDGNIFALAETLTEAATMLDEAGIVTNKLREILTVCNNIGCIAAKPTGAGGGGCILALLHPEHIKLQISKLKDRLQPMTLYEVFLGC